MTGPGVARPRGSDSTADALAAAVAQVRGGGLLAFPTETVWGLGADARAASAVARLRRFKGRGPQAPLSILVDGPAALDALGFDVGVVARGLAERFWPGPLTLVMPCKARFAPGVARDDGAVGVRCSSHPAAAALARRLAAEGVGPITATSLNRSGRPAARTREEARVVCGEGGDAPRLLAWEGDAGGARESTVVDLCGRQPEVLRAGAIEEPALAAALREIAA